MVKDQAAVEIEKNNIASIFGVDIGKVKRAEGRYSVTDCNKEFFLNLRNKIGILSLLIDPDHEDNKSQPGNVSVKDDTLNLAGYLLRDEAFQAVLRSATSHYLTHPDTESKVIRPHIFQSTQTESLHTLQKGKAPVIPSNAVVTDSGETVHIQFPAQSDAENFHRSLVHVITNIQLAFDQMEYDDKHRAKERTSHFTFPEDLLKTHPAFYSILAIVSNRLNRPFMQVAAPADLEEKIVSPSDRLAEVLGIDKTHITTQLTDGQSYFHINLSTHPHLVPEKVAADIAAGYKIALHLPLPFDIGSNETDIIIPASKVENSTFMSFITNCRAYCLPSKERLAREENLMGKERGYTPDTALANRMDEEVNFADKNKKVMPFSVNMLPI